MFTGQERDEETGLMYYGARYYEAKVGRFMAVDPMLQELIDSISKNRESKDEHKNSKNRLKKFISVPQNLNVYSYVTNNPLKYEDPTGKIKVHTEGATEFIMEIITKILNKEELKNNLNYFQKFFISQDQTSINLIYGWATNTEGQYRDIKVSIDEIFTIINQSEKDNIFIMGESDLYLEDLNNKFGFQLCHESDIHFKSDDKKLVDEVLTFWENLGYEPHYARNDESQS